MVLSRVAIFLKDIARVSLTQIYCQTFQLLLLSCIAILLKDIARAILTVVYCQTLLAAKFVSLQELRLSIEA